MLKGALVLDMVSEMPAWIFNQMRVQIEQPRQLASGSVTEAKLRKRRCLVDCPPEKVWHPEVDGRAERRFVFPGVVACEETGVIHPAREAGVCGQVQVVILCDPRRVRGVRKQP